MRATVALGVAVASIWLTPWRTGAQQAPGPPSDLRFTVSGNIVSLQWSAPSAGTAPDAYLVEAGSSPGSSELARLPVPASQTTLVASAPNGRYHVRVRSRSGAIESVPSDEVLVSVGGCTDAPQPPAGLRFALVRDVVTLSWSPSSTGGAASSYIVEAGSAPSLANLATLDTGSPATLFTARAPTGTYFIRVKARNSCGTSGGSNEIALAAGATGTWSVQQRGPLLEFGFGAGVDFPQYAVLDTSSGYFRMIFGRQSTFGTSFLILPSFWTEGRLLQGAPVDVTWRNDGATLVLSYSATITTLRVTGQLVLFPPAGESLSAAVSLATDGELVLDRKPGEAFKHIFLSSMRVSPTQWDAQQAYVESRRLDVPFDGWIIQPPMKGRTFGLVGGVSAWQTNGPAPSIEIVLDRDLDVTGFVARSSNPNDDNAGFWGASETVTRSWQYLVTVTR